MNAAPVIAAEALSVEYRLAAGWTSVLRDVSLQIAPGEIHGLVGESGSGKSTLALALMRFLAPNARISGGRILFGGEDLVTADADALRRLWGKAISLVPQDALDALNPSMRIGQQIAEIVRLHDGVSAAEGSRQAIAMLEHVRIADAAAVARRYPHQLSGGMQQRVCIAMALIARPRLLILDEPTTSLDVTTQAAILDLVRALIREAGAAALYVSHDLGLVAQLCDRVTVLYGGEVMSSGPVEALYSQPLHPYTIRLLTSMPRLLRDRDARLPAIEGSAPALSERPPGCVFAPRCPAAQPRCAAEKPPLQPAGDGRLVRCHRWPEIAQGALHLDDAPPATAVTSPPAGDAPHRVLRAAHVRKRFGGRGGVQALNDVSLEIGAGGTLGVVGESGSGKSTLARCIIGLETADDGELMLLDLPLDLRLSRRPQATLRRLQMIFQNPGDSLNPYRTVGAALARAVRRLSPELPPLAVRERVFALLQAVRLPAEYAARYPGALSGGEKQRVGIARAFAASPALVLADEPTSALDVSVQAVVLNLLSDLRAEQDVSYLFISHDLRAVSAIADHIIVMLLGQVVEQGTPAQVYGLPAHPYTEALLSALPGPGPQRLRQPIRLEGDPPGPRAIVTGCPFHTRCPRRIGPVCDAHVPPWQDAGDGHRIRCHIPPAELAAMQQPLQDAP